jgi:hypothetical protein
MKQPIICYLYTRFDSIQKINDFTKHYRKYRAGLKHKLVICFKLLKHDEIENAKKSLIGIKFEAFVDYCKKNDWDFGSYKRVAKKYYNKDILFLNSHSYPICHNWVKKLFFYKKNKTVIATNASYESMLDSIKLKGQIHKIIRYILRKRKFSKDFKKFPNPHISTNSFLVNSKYFYNYIKNKNLNNKYDTLKIESGINSLTNYFKKKKFDIFVVNSDGKKFTEPNWKLSETYMYKNQRKNIISDKYTRSYNLSNKLKKNIAMKNTWG